MKINLDKILKTVFGSSDNFILKLGGSCFLSGVLFGALTFYPYYTNTSYRAVNDIASGISSFCFAIGIVLCTTPEKISQFIFQCLRFSLFLFLFITSLGYWGAAILNNPLPPLPKPSLVTLILAAIILLLCFIYILTIFFIILKSFKKIIKKIGVFVFNFESNNRFSKVLQNITAIILALSGITAAIWTASKPVLELISNLQNIFFPGA